MPRYTLCPYYKDENKKSISCEDAIRRFDALNSKWSWMDKYCDNRWQDCPYAVALTQAYEKFEEGDRQALETEKIKALERELKGALSRQGRLEKRVDELRAVNQSFTRVNNELEIQKKRYFEKWKESEKKLKDYEQKISNEINVLTQVYEQRMAYLIEAYAPGQKLLEADVKEWAGEHEFALAADYEEDHELAWKVVFKEDGKDVQTKE